MTADRTLRFSSLLIVFLANTPNYAVPLRQSCLRRPQLDDRRAFVRSLSLLA
jgi:hypothetical protein